MKTDVLLSRIFKAIIEKCLDSESAMVVTEALFDSMTPEAYTKIKNTIDNLRTWDYLSLYGGQILRGDVISLQFYDGTGNIFMKRIDLRERVLFKWNRRKVLVFLGILIRALLRMPFKSLGHAHFVTHTSDISLLSEAFVFFHRAGDKQPEKYNLINVSRIELG